MKITLLRAVIYFACVSSQIFSMQTTQFAVGLESTMTAEEVPYLFGRVFIQLVHGSQEEFNAQLEKMGKALEKYPHINIDSKCMVFNQQGAMTSMRSYYKAMKRTELNRHAFAHMRVEEREALQKTRIAALEKLFSDAGKPL